MSKEVKIEGKLDKHLKPLQIDGKSLPVEVAEDDIRISQSLNVEGDITSKGDINIKGNSINYENDTSIVGRETVDSITVRAANLDLKKPSTDLTFRVFSGSSFISVKFKIFSLTSFLNNSNLKFF